MLAGLESPDPPLTDGVVTLRVPDPARDAFAAAAMPDPETVRWIFGVASSEPPDPDEEFARAQAWWSTGSDAYFSVDAAGHEHRVGAARVMFGLVDPFRVAEVGYRFRPEGRGKGYATRAVRLLARWVLEDLALDRLQARTHPENVASQRVLERVGFQREGIARAAAGYFANGERFDCVMWSLLPGEIE